MLQNSLVAGLEPGVVLTGRCSFNVNKGLLTISTLTIRLTDNLTVIKVLCLVSKRYIELPLVRFKAHAQLRS